MGHAESGSVSGTCRASRFSLGCDALLHQLRHVGTHALFAGFIALIIASDFSLPYILRSAFALTLAAPPEALGSKETSQVPTQYVRASLGSRTPRDSAPPHHSGGADVAFDHTESLGIPDNSFFGAH